MTTTREQELIARASEGEGASQLVVLVGVNMVLRRLAAGVVLTTIVGTVGCREWASPRSWHRVTYRLEWDWGLATPLGAEPGWRVTNNRGYEIRVERGYLTSYSMELVECPSERGPAIGFPFDVVGPRRAVAGHSRGTPNPAAILAARVEQFTPPRGFDNGAVTLAPQRYCGTHYLVARAPKGARDLPSEIDLVGKSLHVSGTYRSPGAASPHPFTLSTSVAYGIVRDLFPAESRNAGPTTTILDTGVEGADVVVRRRLGSMFDGVDFDAERLAAVERRVVTNLVEHTQIEVRRPGHAP